MLNPSKYLSRFLNFYTFSIGGGVGEAAMYGALFGAAKNAVSGEDILSGLVTGGALSAATAGLGGELLGEGAKTAATTIPQDSMVGALTSAGTDAATTAATNPSLMGLGGMQNVAATQGAGISALPESSGMLSGASSSMPGQGVAQFTQQTPESVIRNMSSPDSMVNKGLDWWDKQGKLDKAMYSGLAGAGVGALTAKPPALPGQPKEEDNPFGLATYDRNSFTPTDVSPNVYRPGYAVGGAIGMGNQMFPQGQQDHTQYATPTQMPTSREVIDSGYEQATNPYTGDAVVGMAAGGVTHQQIDDYFKGSMVPTPTRTPAAPVTVKDPNAAQTNQYLNKNGRMVASGINLLPQYRQMNGMADYAGNGGSWIRNPTGMFQAIGYNPSTAGVQASYIPTATPDSFIAPNYKPSYADGGIASLGGYAAGGNPRLLKGPGDGMSDDIPATISGKQPARLADGEFVVPADVVSHLGNGSTDAGAKHLYNMMDKVRKARTGRKSQGKQIKPEKYLQG